MLRAVIIDDEQKGIDALRILIEKFVNDVKVVAQTTNAMAAPELIASYRPEVVFLDINMPGMNGFELLDQIHNKNFSLVFTTAHQQHALQALKNNAVDYLLKPVDYEDLQFTISKIKNQLLQKAQSHFDYSQLFSELQGPRQKLLVHSKTGIESLDLGSIVCFESRSNYTLIHLGTHSILSSKTLKEFDVQVCQGSPNFMRVHNSFIINLQKVLRFIKSSDVVVMAGNQNIPLAKSRKQAFYRWLGV